MELLINNFTDAGNHLKYRKEWEKYQKERCNMKTYRHLENKKHYDRIFETLTDNRSIDILNEKSLKNVKKLSEKEYIIKYINENKDKKTPKELAEAIALAIEVPVEDAAAMRQIYNMVMEELRVNPPTLAEVSVAINGRDVPIIASEFGVKAGENIFSTTGVASVVVDEETGEQRVARWAGDEQVQVEQRGMNMEGFRLKPFAGSGERMFFDPGQFSVPTDLPPPMMPIRFNRQALPNTTELPPNFLEAPLRNPPPTYPTTQRGFNQDILRGLFAPEPNAPKEMGTQTEMDYPEAAVKMTPTYIKQYSVGRKAGGKIDSEPERQSMITNTAQTGESGMLATPLQRYQYTTGGYAGSPTRLPSGVKVFDPLQGISPGTGN